MVYHTNFMLWVYTGDIFLQICGSIYVEKIRMSLWIDFLTTKYALWIDTRSSIDQRFHGNSRIREKNTRQQQH